MSDQRPPNFIVVLTQERTASQSVCESLAAVRPWTRLVHAHYLQDPDPPRTVTTPEEALALEGKRRRAAKARAVLGNSDARRAVVTILRDPLDRMISHIWMSLHRRLMKRYLPESGAFKPGARTLIEQRIQLLAESHKAYQEEVYRPLGLPVPLTPGRYEVLDGVKVFALDYGRLAEDFSAACEAMFGRSAPLIHINAGETWGDAEAYAAFRRLCATLVTAERLGL